MTASEAREAADWHREQAMRLGIYNTHGQPHLARQYREDRAHHDRAAVALDAYADRQEMTAEDMVQLVEMGKRAEREACALLADRTEARWREQERTSDDDFARSRCFARADVAATLARAIRARGAK